MVTAILITLGPRDLLLGEPVQGVAALAGVSAERVRCLDRLAERALGGEDSELGRLFLEDGAYVVGCSRPRAVRALLDYAGVGYRAKAVRWEALPFDREALKSEYGVPWYPVIDRARCNGCGTCSDYCLFSVYAVKGAGGEPGARVDVAEPLHCKTGCPACARLCPTGALLFPFCPEAGLNGEEAEPGPRDREAAVAALGDDPMRVLAERRLRKRLIDPARFAEAEKDRILYSGVL